MRHANLEQSVSYNVNLCRIIKVSVSEQSNNCLLQRYVSGTNVSF